MNLSGNQMERFRHDGTLSNVGTNVGAQKIEATNGALKSLI